MFTNKLKTTAVVLGLSLLVAVPFTAHAMGETFYIKICNGLNSYGGKLGPLKHNIEYTVTPDFVADSSTRELTKSLAWDATGNASCGDAMASAKNLPYPLSAQVKIVDQQTGIVLWNGKVIAVADNEVIYSYQPKSIDDAGEPVYFSYIRNQLMPVRYPS